MTYTRDDNHCTLLQNLIASVDEDDSEQMEHLIAIHFEACPECITEEHLLEELLRRFEHSEPPPLTSDMEQRLLDRLCNQHQAGIHNR